MLFEIRDELVTLSEKTKKLQLELSQSNTDQAENIAEFQLLCEHLETRPKGRQIIPNKVAGDFSLAPRAKNISTVSSDMLMDESSDKYKSRAQTQ